MFSLRFRNHDRTLPLTWFLNTCFLIYKTGVLISPAFWKILYITSLVAQRLKRLPALRETWVWFLGRKDTSVVKEMATHSSILAWRIPWAEESGRVQPTGLQRVGRDWATSLSLFILHHFPFLKDLHCHLFVLTVKNSKRIFCFYEQICNEKILFRFVLQWALVETVHT